jgi:tRNA threonylcarbamoyl adenosine modification protein YeaZ
MHCLFFDIASHNATFAVVDDDSVIALRSIEGVVSDDALPTHVEEVLKEASLSYEDITHIACVKGPGGFTSLRVAVTFANVLANQLCVPLAGVHLADLYTSRVSNNDAIWIHSTKRQEVFVQGTTKWPEPTHVILEDALEALKGESLWCGELIPDHTQAIENIGLREAALLPIQEVLPKIVSSLPYSKEQLQPWYGREW